MMTATPSANRRHCAGQAGTARHRLAAIPPWLRKHDEGSGTMAGVMLIMLAGVLMTVAAAAGHLLLCQAKARSASDLAALSAAQAYWDGGTSDPCAVAGRVTAYDAASLERCVVNGDDVSVTVSVATKVPVAPRVSRSSRAGPVECVAPP